MPFGGLLEGHPLAAGPGGWPTAAMHWSLLLHATFARPPARRSAGRRADWVLALALLTGSCGGGSLTGDASVATDADITVLMMGNSHSAVNDLPAQLQAMLRAGLPGRTVAVTLAPGWMFLDERLADPASTALLRSRTWTAVVLQAQKYSTSGRYTYSTGEAEQWVQMARAVGALPVMFPEWPRRGVDETDRIHDLHVLIAQAQPACVAPIGQAWDLAAQRHPSLALHDRDGNHSAPAGAYLTALVLYATTTGGSPLALPALSNGVATEVQADLRQVAADTVQAFPPRRHCPADPTLIPGAAKRRGGA
jgi:hypothetical protein